MEGTVTAVIGPRGDEAVLKDFLKTSRPELEALLGPGYVSALFAPRVRVTLTIFGRPVPVELEAAQVEVLQ
jgi:hypothetical protein